MPPLHHYRQSTPRQARGRASSKAGLIGPCQLTAPQGACRGGNHALCTGSTSSLLDKHVSLSSHIIVSASNLEKLTVDYSRDLDEIQLDNMEQLKELNLFGLYIFNGSTDHLSIGNVGLFPCSSRTSIFFGST